MKTFSTSLLMFILLALFIVPMGVYAQDGDESSPVVFVEGQPPDNAEPIVVTLETPPAAPDYFTLIVGVVAALSGVLLGGGSVAVVAARANASKPLKDSTEALLAAAVPAAITAQVNHTAQIALSLIEKVVVPSIEFINQVTDGQENEEIPQGGK